jgi:hypothetical protein
MKRVVELIHLFFDKFEKKHIEENYNTFQLEIFHNNLKIPEPEKLQKCCQSFPQRDNLIVRVRLDESLPNILNCENFDIDNFLSDVERNSRWQEEGDVFFIEIEIEKGMGLGKQLSLYSLDNFVRFLDTRTLPNLVKGMKVVLKNEKYINFEIQNQIENKLFYFYSSTFRFYSEKSTMKCDPIANETRKELKEKRNGAAHFLNAGYYLFVPEDFHLIVRSGNDKLDSIFNKLTALFSLFYLANISSIEDEEKDEEENILDVNAKIDGMKNIEEDIEFNTLTIDDYKEYFKIYKWVYNEGNLSDKIELARQIISLHVISKNSLALESKTLNAIKSGYIVYLKKDVQQYIDVKNKISEFIGDMFKKSSEIVESFTGTFKNNITAFISFFVSVMILNALSGGKLTDIFTRDISLISIGFLFISLIFLVVAVIDTVQKGKRFSENYKGLKDRYRNILDEEDLKKIFNYDKEYNKDIEFITGQTILYSVLWFSSIVIIFIVILILGDLGSILEKIEAFIKGLFS